MTDVLRLVLNDGFSGLGWQRSQLVSYLPDGDSQIFQRIEFSIAENLVGNSWHEAFETHTDKSRRHCTADQP